MAEWLFEAAGEGGPASPRQIWDIERGTVSVWSGRESVAITPDSPDFELLRAAREKHGLWYPGAFAYSPKDGSALERPCDPAPLSICENGLPSLARPCAGYFAHQQFVRVSGGVAAFAGEPALGFVCDLAEGNAFRWTAKQNWSAPLSIPVQNTSQPLRAPATTTQGFVYVTGDRAVAVVHPGSPSWQRASLSPEGVVALTRPVRTLQGALLLGRCGTGLSTLDWTPEKGWTKTDLPADVIGEAGEFGGVVACQGGMVGICGGRPFHITAERRFVWHEVPAAFVATAEAIPFVTRSSVYFVGTAAASGRGAWAALAKGRIVADLLLPEAPFSPALDGFVGETGWSAGPEPGATSGYRLPRGWVGLPLLKFDDAILFLAIEAGMLWADAIAHSRRRWTTCLMLSGADGSVRELYGSMLDRLTRVQAMMIGGSVGVIGLKDDEALLFADPPAGTESIGHGPHLDAPVEQEW